MYRIMIDRDTRSRQGFTQSIKRSISSSLILILGLLLDCSSASTSPLPLPSSAISTVTATVPRSQSRKPNWFHSLRQRLKFNKLQLDNSEGDVSSLGNVFVISLRWSLMGYIGFEIFNVIKDLIQEIKEESGGLGGGGFGFGTLISKSNTERLLTWMADPNPGKKPHPPYQVPSMIHRIALQLQASGMPLFSSSSDDPITSPPSIADILPRLTKPQAQLLTDCLLVPDPSVTLNQVSGLVQVRQALRSLIPRTRILNTDRKITKNPFASFVADQHQQQGIMLYGPPGCGKSLLIKAFAGECRRPTLVIAPSTLQRKYYGESNQQVKLLWSLVTNVFQNHVLLVMDELDGLFRESNGQENEISRSIKTEFLQLWEGVASKNNNDNDDNGPTNQHLGFLMVIGATNRPFDVDPAVARRLPQSFFIGFPPLEDRRALLRRWCYDFEIPVGSDLLEPLAQATYLYTPSDLKQVLRQACQGGPLARGDLQLHLADIQRAMQQVPATKLHSTYVGKMHQYMGFRQNGDPPNPNQQQDQIEKWETPMGNFYYVGHISVDAATSDALDLLGTTVVLLWGDLLVLLSSRMNSEMDDDSSDDDYSSEEGEDDL
jgi:ATP-dependent 26S proteasome regulatory subunit